MATVGSHIDVGNSPLGQQIKSMIASLESTSTQIRELKTLLDKLTAGGVTPTNLEAILGFTSNSGEAGALYTDIVNLNANIVNVQSIQDTIYNLKSIS